MVGLIVDSGYERLSSTLFVNSVYNSSKMALVFAKTKLNISFFSQLRTSILKMFSGPKHGGPYSRNSIVENV